MYNIIGLGSAGCSIAEKFENLSDFNVKLIDVDIEGENCINISRLESHHEYDRLCPDLSKELSNIQNNVILILAGGGNISGMALSLLRQLKDRCFIKVIYIRPDIDTIGNNQIIKEEKITFNVLQEYARSGAFVDILLVSNLQIEKILKKVSISNYYEKINETFFSTFTSILNLAKSKPVMENSSKPLDFFRINTMGFYDIETDEEKLFFPLDYIDYKTFYFVLNEDQLTNDGDLFKIIKDKMKTKNNDITKVAYKIYSSSSKENYCFMTAQSRKIQE